MGSIQTSDEISSSAVEWRQQLLSQTDWISLDMPRIQPLQCLPSQSKAKLGVQAKAKRTIVLAAAPIPCKKICLQPSHEPGVPVNDSCKDMHLEEHRSDGTQRRETQKLETYELEDMFNKRDPISFEPVSAISPPNPSDELLWATTAWIEPIKAKQTFEKDPFNLGAFLSHPTLSSVPESNHENRPEVVASI